MSDVRKIAEAIADQEVDNFSRCHDIRLSRAEWSSLVSIIKRALLEGGDTIAAHEKMVHAVEVSRKTFAGGHATGQQRWERVQALLAPHIPLGLERSQLVDAIMDATAERPTSPKEP